MKLQPTRNSNPEFVIVTGTADDPVGGTGLTAYGCSARECGPEGLVHYTREELEQQVKDRKLFKGKVMTYAEWNKLVDESYVVPTIVGLVNDKGLLKADSQLKLQMDSYVAKQADTVKKKKAIIESFGEAMYKQTLKTASGTSEEIEAREYTLAEVPVHKGGKKLTKAAVEKLLRPEATPTRG